MLFQAASSYLLAGRRCVGGGDPVREAQLRIKKNKEAKAPPSTTPHSIAAPSLLCSRRRRRADPLPLVAAPTGECGERGGSASRATAAGTSGLDVTSPHAPCTK